MMNESIIAATMTAISAAVVAGLNYYFGTRAAANKDKSVPVAVTVANEAADGAIKFADLLSARLSVVEADLQQLRQLITEKDKTIAALTLRVASLERSILQKDAEILGLTTKINHLEQERDELIGKLEKLEDYNKDNDHGK